ncbi:mechanosensitive ion channel [Paracoccus sp. TK19116]|uniref:Mechanosensitive ion channel n=1 Tax=Paracoccus albicereus TaxID=2922394 RepID=A0ABT1MQ19_9RHOB|nr:mechanosensitive ion channel domain-containing protein [Paracoccus albicereus]MCQ0970402.1 mechanosensitive ion channel [Paracoccus albicereus]
MKQVFFSVILTVLITIGHGAAAQDAASSINYDRWEQFAEQAENIIAAEDSEAARLEDIRSRAVQWREEFDGGQGVNATRIAAVEDQISALGPAPAEGETEDAGVAARRETLNEQLSTLTAPRLAAVEAYSRADAIISNIDMRLDEIQAAQATKLYPSPLMPTSWQAALSEAGQLASGIGEGTRAALNRSGGLAELGDRLPKVLGYLALAILLLTYGRRWIDTMPSRLSARSSKHSRAVVAFLVSLGQIIIPMLGVLLAVSALTATGWFREWTRPLLIALPPAGVILFGGFWLARQIFPARAIAYASLDIPDAERRTARNATNWLAAILALQSIVAHAILPASVVYPADSVFPRVPFEMSDAAATVWHFVFVIASAVFLFRLGNVLRRMMRWTSADDLKMRNRVMMIAGAISRIIAVFAVIAGAVGVINLAIGFVVSWAFSLALIGFLVLLQDFIADLFDMMKRGKEGARDGLAPLLIGIALVIVSIPLFLLIWGASVDDLSEIWTRVQRGITLGGITLSPGAVLTFVIVFTLGYFITRGLQGTMRSSILPKTRIDAGGQNALVSGLGYVGIVLAALFAITSAGIDLSSLAIVAGALSLGIGFGLQNIVQNFVSGIILLIERPISVGDWVDAGGQQGIVKRISVRSTAVETFDKTEVIVPNSDLVSQPVTNWTKSSRNGRVIIPVGVAYGTDTRKVESILREIIEDQPTVMIDPAPAVLFRGLGADSLDFEIRAILSDVSGGLGVTSDVLHEVVRRFAEEGIEIPYAQRDIWLRNPEALSKAAPSTPQGGGDDKVGKPSSDPSSGSSEGRRSGGTSDTRLIFDGDADGGGQDGGDGDGGR